LAKDSNLFFLPRKSPKDSNPRTRVPRFDSPLPATVSSVSTGKPSNYNSLFLMDPVHCTPARGPQLVVDRAPKNGARALSFSFKNRQKARALEHRAPDSIRLKSVNRRKQREQKLSRIFRVQLQQGKRGETSFLNK
jgi:hypothetical protein